MESDFDSTTVSIEDLRAGHAEDLLAEADVVIAIDATTHEEEVVHGREEWELASATGHDEELVVLRVELDMNAGDFEWLVDAIEAIEGGETNEEGDDLDGDEEDDD
jgi:hypothetical protein